MLADIAESCQLSVEIDEAALPIGTTARHAAEMLGLDPLTVANEGKCVLVVAADAAERVLTACRGARAGPAGGDYRTSVGAGAPAGGAVTRIGGRRVVQRPYGEELPRIC